MPDLERLKPVPIPAIHPLPEYAVEGQRAEWYAEMKTALQVPWMGVVTMAYAHYPAFFAALWNGTRELVASRTFVERALEQQRLIEEEVAMLAPPLISDRLAGAGYGEREIEQIRDVNRVFSHGNHAYALIAAIARLLMEGQDMQGSTESALEPYAGRHAPDVDVPFLLMEAHHADAPTVAVYDDIKSVLGLPFINTDYRAFARWPSYWAMAWSDLRQVAGTPAHEALCLAYHDRAVAAVLHEFPNPGGLTSETLRAAAQTDASVEEVLAVCRLFQWLLPGLAVNVAYLRWQLQA